MNPSWLPVYKMPMQWNTSGYCCEVSLGGVRIPVLFFHRLFNNPYSTIQHEAIHAVRYFVSYSRFKMFEEAIADYNELGFLRNSVFTCDTESKKRLEDKFEDKAGHILIRLLPPEIYAIASSKEPERLLKDWGCMRHRIIRERLGL